MLGRAFKNMGYTVWGRDELDFQLGTDVSKLKSDVSVKIANFDVVVNTIAKTDTRWCEQVNNYAELMWTNCDVPTILGSVCNDSEKKFIHISTGCLYEDGIHPNSENDSLVARGKYQHSKLSAEYAIQMVCPDAAILRPRLLFADFDHPSNLLTKLSKFDSFTISPETITSCDSIVDIVAKISNTHRFRKGPINIGCQMPISPHNIVSIVGMKDMDKNIKIYDPPIRGYRATSTIMNITEFGVPRNTIEELKRCWRSIRFVKSGKAAPVSYAESRRLQLLRPPSQTERDLAEFFDGKF